MKFLLNSSDILKDLGRYLVCAKAIQLSTRPQLTVTLINNKTNIYLQPYSTQN